VPQGSPNELVPDATAEPTSTVALPDRSRVRFRLALKLSALVTLSLVASLVAFDWLITGGDPAYRQAQLKAYVFLALVGGLLFAGVLDLLVTRPVDRLVDQVRSAIGEDWETPIQARGQDEISELGHALEALRQSVVIQRQELRRWNAELEQRVGERTRQLEAARDQLVQAEKLAGLGQLAAGVAHEVNNPCGVILSRAGYLLSVADEEGLDPDVIDDIEAMEHQARRIARIAGDLLTFGRPTSKGRAPVALADVVELTANVLRHNAKTKGITLTIDLVGRAPVVADRDQLEQVAFNLIKNALDATNEGGEVTARADDDTLSVEDNGTGIDDAVLARIFDPFFTTKEVGEGSGLGLAITYGIVSEHGGTITATSRKGEGTRMVVILPLASGGDLPSEQENST